MLPIRMNDVVTNLISAILAVGVTIGTLTLTGGIAGTTAAFSGAVNASSVTAPTVNASSTVADSATIINGVLTNVTSTSFLFSATGTFAGNAGTVESLVSGGTTSTINRGPRRSCSAFISPTGTTVWVTWTMSGPVTSPTQCSN